MEFIRDYQTLLAGCIAIFAAWVAYRGALAQVNTNLAIAQRTRDEECRAAASAFWAELTYCNVELMAEASRLKKSGQMTNTISRPNAPDTSIYDSNPRAVGILSSNEAYSVTTSYKLIKGLQAHYAKLADQPGGIANDTAEHLIRMVEGVVKITLSTTNGLARAAGIPDDQANSIREAYQRMIAGKEAAHLLETKT
jgi:hypothetical protein